MKIIFMFIFFKILPTFELVDNNFINFFHKKYLSLSNLQLHKPIGKINLNDDRNFNVINTLKSDIGNAFLQNLCHSIELFHIEDIIFGYNQIISCASSKQNEIFLGKMHYLNEMNETSCNELIKVHVYKH